MALPAVGYWVAIALCLCVGYAAMRRPPALSLRGRVVWVTGASSGIGEALAIALAGEGALLVLSARRADRLEALRDRLGVPADDVLVLPLDVTDADAFAGAVARVLARFGRIDVLIHNAGVSQRAAFQDMAPAAMRQVMEVNFFGPAFLTKAVLPSMLERKVGHVVVISSVQGKVGLPNRAMYAASKHALHGCFDSLRAEHHRDGIAVTLVTPGYVDTDLAANALTADGSPSGQREARTALPAAACARRIVQAIRGREEEVVVAGWKETAAVVLQRAAPGVLRRVVRL